VTVTNGIALEKASSSSCASDRSGQQQDGKGSIVCKQPEFLNLRSFEQENVQPTAQDDVPEFASLDQAVKAYEALLQSHRQLQQIRQTEPERLLKDFIRAAERERTGKMSSLSFLPNAKKSTQPARTCKRRSRHNANP